MAKLGYDPKKLSTCITEGIGNNTYEDGECANFVGMKCYIIGDYVINHPKAKYEFEYLRMEEVIPTIKKHLKSN